MEKTTISRNAFYTIRMEYLVRVLMYNQKGLGGHSTFSASIHVRHYATLSTPNYVLEARADGLWVSFVYVRPRPLEDGFGHLSSDMNASRLLD